VSQAFVKNSFSSIGEVEASISPSSLVLKLSVTHNALRYFVSSHTHQQVIFFGDYTLHHVSDEKELAQRIEKIFEKDEVLQLPFSKILIGLDEKYSLVPKEFSSLISRDNQMTQSCGDTEIAFTSKEEITKTLKRLFTGPRILHLNSTYLHLFSETETVSKKLFVNVSSAHFDIIRFDADNKLQLMNRYEYKAATDFIYFLLLCAEELKIDREQTELVLSGEVETESKIYDLCYRYFRNISFITKPDNVNFAKAFDDFPKHLHFNLYNLSA